MRRAHLFLAVAIAATPSFARPVAVPKPIPPNHVLLQPNHVLLNLNGMHLFRQPAEPSTGFTAWSTHVAESRTPSLSRLGAGALHAEFGLDDNPRANISGYQLQGVDQLGSSMWQAERGKSAKLMFTWPTDK
jgi:hypothetical protein